MKTLDQITRKEAQAALRSPEELDKLMAVTGARGWITLSVVAVIIAVALAWGFFGSISKIVAGQGMLLTAVDPIVLHAQGEGRVSSIAVANGDQVAAGQVLLKIDNVVLEKSLAAARAELRELQRAGKSLTAGEKARLETAKSTLAQKMAKLNRNLEDTQKLIALQQQQLEAENELLQERLIPKQQWIDTQRQMAQLVEQKLDGEAQLQQAKLEYQQTEMAIQQAREDRGEKIIEAQAQVAEFEARSRSELKVFSPVDGRILELRVGPFSQVAAGADLVEILAAEGIADRCVAYADAKVAKKIKKGMRALVSPSIAEPEKYGYLVGEVTAVSEFISSKADILQMYENENFTSSILKSYPAPLGVVVRLLVDPNTPSGYKWTSSSGLPGKISPGTICDLKVEVQQDRPIDLLLPWLRKTTGIDD